MVMFNLALGVANPQGLSLYHYPVPIESGGYFQSQSDAIKLKKERNIRVTQIYIQYSETCVLAQ
ncbi:hypothetical protein D3C74_115580 [compost metagenome]